MQTMTRIFCLALGALATCATGTAGAADAAPAAGAAAPPAGELQELDEILVRGTSLRERIADAEDEFFQLYNKINKNDDYDASCVYVNTDSLSKIKSRMCIPGFYADALADQVYFMMQCQSDTVTDNEGNTTEYAAMACFTPPSPQVVLTQRAKDYANNMMKVINSDPRLQKMAGGLDDMYHELVGIQTQYLKIKASTMSDRKPAAPVEGPRSH
jgi:hypothetical protein